MTDSQARWLACRRVATTGPPAARMTSPVIQADSSDARNTASGAISVTRPSLPSGVFLSQNGAGPTLKGSRGYIAFGFCMTGSDGVDADLAREFTAAEQQHRFRGQ